MCACNGAKKPTGVDISGKPPTAADIEAPVYDETWDGIYWEAVGFDDLGTGLDEYSADIFLWEDGTGYFRFIQGVDEDDISSWYAFRDTFPCGWVLDGDTLSLTDPRSGVYYQGTIAGGRLSIPYDGFGDGYTIIMEQTLMPPYGAHWDMPLLYDSSWLMVSYTDRNGTTALDNGIFSVDDKGEGMYIYSELYVKPTYLADFCLLARDNSQTGNESISLEDLTMVRSNGALYEDCPNQAWYAELIGNDVQQRLGISYADGKLFLLKGDGQDGAFPDSFTAIFEQIDID